MLLEIGVFVFAATCRWAGRALRRTVRRAHKLRLLRFFGYDGFVHQKRLTTF